MMLKDRVAIITGGGSGMGREMCLEYAAEGASLAVVSNVPEQIESVAAECRALGAKAIAIAADVTSDAEVAAMVDRTVAEFGRIDTIVCNAGIGTNHVGPKQHLHIADVTNDMFARVLEVNVMGVVRCARAVIPTMVAQGSGVILATSSGTVRRPYPGLGAYISSKFAVEGFVKVLAQELEPQNIRVNTIQPGGTVDTGLIGVEIGADERKKYHQPSVIRKMAAWIASDEARYITGRSMVAMEWNKERGLVLCPCDRCSTRDPKLSLESRGLTAL